MASNATGQTRSLFRHGPDLQFREVLADVVPAPWEVATMASRPGGADGRSLIHVIAWSSPAQIGGGQEFPMLVLTYAGDKVREMRVNPPRPSNGFVIYPTGLAWDSASQVFYYLERNSDTIVKMDTDGQILSLAPHPSPPLQSFVFNLGLCFDHENGALYLTGSGPRDHRITKALQLTRAGRLTGIEIPLGHLSMSSLHGISMDGPDLIANGYGANAEAARIIAFHPIPPPGDLACSARGPDLLLSWTPPLGAERVAVLRGGQEIADLPANAASYIDRAPNRAQPLVYSVLGRRGDQRGKNRFCELPPLPAGFIRGDANSTGAMDLTDAIVILSYLFLSGPPPECDDAADADDSGSLSITDPILILGRLFLGAPPLPAPYPDPGQDPTIDSLTCS